MENQSNDYTAIPKNILEVFPNAKYVEATHWEIEDDKIELTSKLHIQVGQDSYYLVEEGNGNDGMFFEYIMNSTKLIEVYKKAIENTCGFLN